MAKRSGLFIILLVVVFGVVGNAKATPITGTPTDASGTAVDYTLTTLGIEFFVPLVGPGGISEGTYGVDDGGNFGTVADIVTVPPPINGPLMHMYLLFEVPDGHIGHTLTLTFTDLDLIPSNDPYGFYERLILYGEDGLPVGTFESYEDPTLSLYVDDHDIDGSILTFTGLSIGPGDSLIHLGFQAYSGDGEPLPPLDDGTWRNTAEYLIAELDASAPEPATMLLLGSGLLGLAGLRRKFRRR